MVSTMVDLQGNQAPDTSWWDDRDRAAGFQPDRFVWYDAVLSTRLTAVYGGNPNGCVQGSVTFSSVHPTAYSWANLAMSPTPTVDINSFLRGEQSYLTDLAGDLGELCGSDWWVSTVEHNLRVYEIPASAVRYGDTPMVHPEAVEIVSFLDWLWETTDSYEQMVQYLQSLSTYPGDPKPQGLMDQGAYFLALDLLSN